jgi:hypothetical protein
VLGQSSAMLLNLDRSFKIELAWLAAGAYQALSGVVDAKIMACFPTKEAAVTMAQCRARLAALKEDMLYKMASRQSQSAVDSMASVIAKMASGMAPPESFKTAGGIFTMTWGLMPYFARYTQVGGPDITGSEALTAKFTDLQKLLKKEKRPAQLFELDQFKALATPHDTQTQFRYAVLMFHYVQKFHWASNGACKPGIGFNVFACFPRSSSGGCLRQ